MGLGSKTPRLKTYYMSPRGYKDKKLNPHFIVRTKDETGTMVRLPDETEVSGTLVSISHGEYDYEGKKVKTVTLLLFDDNAYFKVSSDMNSNNMRQLMNTICGTQTFDYIRLSLYAKNDYPTLYVSDQPGKSSDRVKWKFDYKKQIEPLITEQPDLQDPTKKVKVYHAVNQLLLDEWKRTELIVAEYARKKGYDKLGLATIDQSSTEHLDEGQRRDVDEFVPPNEEPFPAETENAPGAGFYNPPVAPVDDLPF